MAAFAAAAVREHGFGGAVVTFPQQGHEVCAIIFMLTC